MKTVVSICRFVNKYKLLVVNYISSMSESKPRADCSVHEYDKRAAAGRELGFYRSYFKLQDPSAKSKKASVAITSVANSLSGSSTAIL